VIQAHGLLLDLDIGPVGGMHFLRWFRTHDAYRRTPIIAFTHDLLIPERVVAELRARQVHLHFGPMERDAIVGIAQSMVAGRAPRSYTLAAAL
jgi:hypothetical protein